MCPALFPRRPGVALPSTHLSQAQAAEMTTNVYMGQVTLDVNLYREAKWKAATSAKAMMQQYEKTKSQHVRDVKTAQDFWQAVELVFDNVSSQHTVAGKWLPVCAHAAEANAKALQKHLGVEAWDIATLNIVSLNNMGPLKSQIVTKLQQELPHFVGGTLVFQPVIPRQAFSRSLDTLADAATQMEEESADDDSNVAETSDDEGEQAALGATLEFPDSVTKSSSRLTSKQRFVNLAADRQVVERALTVELKSSAVLPSHFANRVHVIHAPDASNNRKVTEAIMIAPTSEDTTGLEQSIALRHGAFVDVENVRSFVVVSRKEAARARRALMEGWSFDSKLATCKLSGNSLFQGQIGQCTVETVLKDFAKTCDRKVLLVNDMVAGVGEVALAALGARLSNEARESGVRVCYWGSEFRRVQREVASARFKTEIGKAYLAGKLEIPGMSPVPMPDQPKGNLGDINLLLERPLQKLTIDGQGNLVLPPLSSVPVAVSEELKELWEVVSAEFPFEGERPAKKAAVGANPGADPGAGTGAAPGPAPGAGTGAAPGADPLAAGTRWADRAALELAEWVILKASPSPIPHVTLLLASKGRDGKKHVFMENSSDGNIKVQSGTFVGRAGEGNFHGSQDVPPEQAEHGWTFTRLTEYKKDTAKLASGNVVWAGSNAGTGNVAAAGVAAPKMVTLETCEAELGTAVVGASKCVKVYGHATTRTARTVRIVPSDKPCIVWAPRQRTPDTEFNADNFGQWLRSREAPAVGDSTKVNIECMGLLRPCFEVTFVHSEKMLKPIRQNPLCLFTINAVSLNSKQVVSL